MTLFRKGADKMTRRLIFGLVTYTPHTLSLRPVVQSHKTLDILTVNPDGTNERSCHRLGYDLTLSSTQNVKYCSGFGQLN